MRRRQTLNLVHIIKIGLPLHGGDKEAESHQRKLMAVTRIGRVDLLQFKTQFSSLHICDLRKRKVRLNSVTI
jgi:hypothetical protein